MSQNIIITEGIKEPWELKGTNYDKPEEIVIANLAVGQLAFIGSAFGKYLSTQATVTAELASAVNKVRDRSTEVSSLFSNWNSTSPQFDLVMPAQGAYPVQPSKVDVNSSDPSTIDKLVIANNLITQNQIANRFIPPLKSFPTNIADGPCTYTFGPIGPGEMITGFSPYGIAMYSSGPPVPDFELYAKKDATGAFDFSKVFVNFGGEEYEAKNLTAIWIPESKAQIDYFNNQLSLTGPAINSRVLTDTTQLVPVPSELNTSTQNGSGIMTQASVTMEISLGQADYLEFKLENGEYFYYEKPASQIPLYSADTVASHVGSVVQMADNTYRYVGEPSGVLATPYPLIAATPKPCVKNPTDLQKSEWLSQYSDKVVRITQRSSEQTTYVNALVQRYNYFYEAATNVLKSFTSLWASLSGNI